MNTFFGAQLPARKIFVVQRCIQTFTVYEKVKEIKALVQLLSDTHLETSNSDIINQSGQLSNTSVEWNLLCALGRSGQLLVFESGAIMRRNN